MNNANQGGASLRKESLVVATNSRSRLRNVLAVVRTIVRRTAENSTSVETFAANLDGRINAYGRAISELGSDEDCAIDLAMLVADTLVGYGIHEGARATISGPAVQVRGKTAETLSLMFYELATNAIQHGAIDTSDGSVTVTWTTDNGLNIRWLETGHSAVRPVNPDGFGFRLLKHGLPYELSAQTNHMFGTGNLIWEISIPQGDSWNS